MTRADINKVKTDTEQIIKIIADAIDSGSLCDRDALRAVVGSEEDDKNLAEVIRLTFDVYSLLHARGAFTS